MSRLSAIPVRVDRDAPTPLAALDSGTIGGGVTAILMQIATRLERLAEGGEADAIDLRSLPMSADDQQRLIEALGPGEVTITLQADGESTIRETGVRGVWWTEYRDRGGAQIATFIEVARVPAILPVALDELRDGAQQLRRDAKTAATSPRSS